MRDKSGTEFLEAIASKAPTPGGGGASAYVGALGIALGSMVGRLTEGKKKYAHVEEEIQELLIRSDGLREKFCQLVDQDEEAFAPLAAAYHLPSFNESEKEEKERAIQNALTKAAVVPLEIAECSLEAIKILCEYAQKGSVMVESDAGTGLYFCRAALLGARLNVMVNIKLMKDRNLRDKLSHHLDKITDEGLRLADTACALIEEHMQ